MQQIADWLDKRARAPGLTRPRPMARVRRRGVVHRLWRTGGPHEVSQWHPQAGFEDAAAMAVTLPATGHAE
jgi:hypothetical protein